MASDAISDLVAARSAEIIETRRFFLGHLVSGERLPLDGVFRLEPPPTGEILFVEQRREALGRLPG